MLTKLRQAYGKHVRTREFMYYDGDHGMKVVKLTARAQVLAAALVTSLVGYGAVATGVAATASVDPAMERELAASQHKVDAMRAKLAAIENDVAMQAARFDRRQAFLTELFEGEAGLDDLASLMPLTGETAAVSPSLMAPFSALEKEQLAFVDGAASAAAARYRDHAATLKTMGLKPERFVRQTTLAMGGPDVDAAAEGGPLADADPRFAELFVNWKKLDLLEKGLSAVPSFKPVKSYTYTSGYGIRFDPFKGTTAMHQGVDMSGPVGEPIYAAGEGKVVKAGRHGGYGKLVEIDHGNGLTTRYAHMSRLNVRVGDRVARGEKVGGMGSTGRSTGSHLHYEVRLDGRAVNPMPFLEAGDFAMAKTEGARGGAE